MRGTLTTLAVIIIVTREGVQVACPPVLPQIGKPRGGVVQLSFLTPGEGKEGKEDGEDKGKGMKCRDGLTLQPHFGAVSPASRPGTLSARAH